MTDQLTYYGNRKLVKKQQDTKDIVSLMLHHHKMDASEYDKIAEQFLDKTPAKTAKGLFDYVKENIAYDIEPEAKQTVRTPGAILYLGKGDCKHYANFINGVGDALRRKGYPIEPVYRFASYDKSTRTPHHVFAVWKTPQGEIWIDPVLQSFNQRTPYFYKIDKPTSMLESISGVSPTQTMYMPPTKAATAVTPEQSRMAFLTMLKLNLYGLAENMRKEMLSNPAIRNDVLSVWKQYGGRPDELYTAIDAGIKFWKSKHIEETLTATPLPKNQYGYDARFPIQNMIGIVPVVLAAIVSAGGLLASAIINKVGKKNSSNTNTNTAPIVQASVTPDGQGITIQPGQQQTAATAPSQQVVYVPTAPTTQPQISNDLKKFYEENKTLIQGGLLLAGGVMLIKALKK